MKGEESRDALVAVVVIAFAVTINYLGYLDYKARTAHCGPVMEPTFNLEETDQ